jgi:hypothetical protein
MLGVMPPSLAYEGKETGFAALEKPVDVVVGPVTSDGAVVGPEGLATFAYHIYRRAAPGAALDIWDAATSAWTSELVTDIERAPTQLAYRPGDPEPWRGIIVGAGGRDAAGQPQFERAVGGFPLYSVRAFFEPTDRSEALLSGPSENLAFVGGADRNLMVMGPGDGEELDAATEARVLLKSASLQTIGRLLMERDAPGATVTLDNAAGASIVLHRDGRIEITPAPGQPVVVQGDLETERITYRPAGGGVKQTLG